MARYIDVEALIAEYDRVHIGPAGGARKLMVEAPVVDVVPKSEVEKTIGEWAYLHADVLNKLKTAKAEVAREIFEEIEKLVASRKLRRGLIGDLLESDIAELKKKYTEGGD